MWIEIKHGELKTLVNISAVIAIAYCENGVWFGCAGAEKVHIDADSLDQAKTLYDGVVLALNGLDFHIEETGNYIKPLLACKNAALHNHLMLQQVLADRSI